MTPHEKVYAGKIREILRIAYGFKIGSAERSRRTMTHRQRALVVIDLLSELLKLVEAEVVTGENAQ